MGELDQGEQGEDGVAEVEQSVEYSQLVVLEEGG